MVGEGDGDCGCMVSMEGRVLMVLGGKGIIGMGGGRTS